jgi:hypothetical protein
MAIPAHVVTVSATGLITGVAPASTKLSIVAQ